MQLNPFKAVILSLCVFSFAACDSKKPEEAPTQQQEEIAKQEPAEVLPFLNIEEAKAKFAVPFCEKKNCMELDIQTINTQDAWMNQWIADSQSKVIQDQIGSNQIMSLQQAVNAYVKKSDEWQKEFIKNKAYELYLQTRIASQRNQYVLLQVIVNSKQAEVNVKDRGYFFVADRKSQKKLGILDVIDTKKKNALNDIIQAHYTEWMAEQKSEVKKLLPKKLFWGQNDWFFDNEGIGIHYRASEIAKDASQLDIYLNKAQTQQILKAEIFEKMF